MHLLLYLILTGCSNEKLLIGNEDRLNDIEKMLKVQKELTAHALLNIWDVLDKPASLNEEQALKFIFAYMPLSDLADYSPAFVLANVRQSLLARKEMTWGSAIPEEEFLHFVLPLRVNNENLDSFRLAYYDEIKARIKGLSMKDAALEINHWCHEKVNYRGTDSRTSAPMSTIKKSFGRCGEESTFTVTAMRTAGIPSRQVYTPRWAHTDDNHAWVEVWIDGKWHFMGACEPDAELDRGWFSEPSQRTMLVHTRTYGRYFGSEEVLDAEDRFSELNLTTSYAITKKVTIIVNNPNGNAVEGAKVAFKLYNYAEFYPLATIQTDSNGIAKFTTGLGDLLVWASKDGRFAYKKLNVLTTDTLRLLLEVNRMESMTENLDMVPPKISKAVLPVNETEKKLNDKRLSAEDSIRNNYMTTFRDSAWIRSYADAHMLSADSLMRMIRLSYGNWKEMISYVENNRSSARRLLFPLTYGISDKDLSDTRAAILSDHLTGPFTAKMNAEIPNDLFEKYILEPRVDLEILSPWRSFLGKNLGSEMADSTKKDIKVLTNWIKTNITVDPVANKHSRAPLTPVGVYSLRAADPLSRDIFFVAACRTFGIPARLNPEIHAPEYWSGTWYRAGFDTLMVQPEMGKLILKEENNNLTPQYSLHFTIAKIQNGVCKTMEFEEGRKVIDFPDAIFLETGNYLLVTGKRLTDGTVLSSLTFFDIKKDQSTTVKVELRKETATRKPLGFLDPASIHLTDITRNNETILADLMMNRSAVIVLLDPDSEPSKHILIDLGPFISQFNDWDGCFIFVNTRDKGSKSEVFQNYRLPAKTSLSVDKKNELEQKLTPIAGKEVKNNLPAVVFCEPNGEVLMLATGYKIGMGESLLQLIKNIGSDKARISKTSCTTP